MLPLPGEEPSVENANVPEAGLVAYLYNSDMGAKALSEGIVAYYPLDGDACDRSTNANHATIFNAVPATDRYGNDAGAYYFNGSNSYIRAPHQPHLNTLPITVSCWFSLADPPKASGALVTKYFAASWNGYGMLLGSGAGTNVIGPHYSASYGRDLSDGYGGTNPTFHSSLVNNTNWHMVTFTADTNGGILYLDGIANTNHAWRGAPLVATSLDPLLIGKYQHYPDALSKYFKGAISDVLIYKRALSENEVATLYKLDFPRDITKESAIANPVPAPSTNQQPPPKRGKPKPKPKAKPKKGKRR